MNSSELEDFLVFLDRDGTIIEDRHYLSDPHGVVLLPGAVDGLRSIQALGGRLVVITNQSGIGRGYFDRRAADDVNDRLRELLGFEGIILAGILLCPHRPEDACECRKPGTLLFNAAAIEQNLSLNESYVIGDRSSDVEAGRRFGARTLLISEVPGQIGASGEDRVVTDLVEAAEFIASSRSDGH